MSGVESLDRSPNAIAYSLKHSSELTDAALAAMVEGHFDRAHALVVDSIKEAGIVQWALEYMLGEAR